MSRPQIPATVWMLGLVSLFMDISSEMVNALLPLYLATTLQASALTIGVVEGLSVVIAAAVKYLSGLMVDLSGRMKFLAVLGYGLGALSRLIFPFATAVDHVMFAKAIDRVGKGIRSAPRDAMITAVTPPPLRGAAFGLRKSLDSMGGFIGPLVAVAAMLAFAGDISQVFLLAALPAALSVAVLLFATREPDTPGKSAKTPFRLKDSLTLTRSVWAVIALASVIMLARFSEAFLLLKGVDAGLGPTWVPLALVVLHLLYGLLAYPAGRLSDRIGTRGLIVASLFVLMAAHLVLASASTIPLYLLGTALWGIHMGLSQGLLGVMIASATPDHLKGSAFGAFNLVTGLLMLLGNSAAGGLWAAYGSAAPFLAGAGISALAVLLTLTLRRPAP